MFNLDATVALGASLSYNLVSPINLPHALG